MGTGVETSRVIYSNIYLCSHINSWFSFFLIGPPARPLAAAAICAAVLRKSLSPKLKHNLDAHGASNFGYIVVPTAMGSHT